MRKDSSHDQRLSIKKDEFEHDINKYNENIEKLRELLREKAKNPFENLAEGLACPDVDCINENLKELNEVFR